MESADKIPSQGSHLSEEIRYYFWSAFQSICGPHVVIQTQPGFFFVPLCSSVRLRLNFILAAWCCWSIYARFLILLAVCCIYTTFYWYSLLVTVFLLADYWKYLHPISWIKLRNQILLLFNLLGKTMCLGHFNSSYTLREKNLGSILMDLKQSLLMMPRGFFLEKLKMQKSNLGFFPL